MSALNTTPFKRLVIIALAGAQGAGKDTFGEALGGVAYSLGHSFGRVAFADALRQECAEVLAERIASPSDLPTDYVKWEEHFLKQFQDRETKGHYRPFLQWWATEFRRRHGGEDYWVRFLDEGLRGQEEDPDWPEGRIAIVPITDLRHPAELEWVKAVGGKIVYLYREKMSVVQDDHSSENHHALLEAQADFKVVNVEGEPQGLQGAAQFVLDAVLQEWWEKWGPQCA